MNTIKHDCQLTSDLLVEYADCELVAEDADRVAGHLERCEACRAELRLLQRSLELAQEVWQESVAVNVSSVQPTCRVRPRRTTIDEEIGASGTHPTEIALLDKPAVTHKRWAMAVGVAAALMLMLAGVAWLMPHAGPTQPEGVVAANKSDAAGQPPMPKPEDDVQRYIAREASAARLAASAAVLSTQPGLEEYHRRAERYIIENYGDTTAGRELAGRSPPSKPAKEPQS